MVKRKMESVPFSRAGRVYEIGKRKVVMEWGRGGTGSSEVVGGGGRVTCGGGGDTRETTDGRIFRPLNSSHGNRDIMI